MLRQVMPGYDQVRSG